MTERSIEEPEDDAAEQRRSAVTGPDGSAGWIRETPLDVDEADAAEQSRAVEIDEDEYR
jgi:hypothetical protein